MNTKVTKFRSTEYLCPDDDYLVDVRKYFKTMNRLAPIQNEVGSKKHVETEFVSLALKPLGSNVKGQATQTGTRNQNLHLGRITISKKKWEVLVIIKN